MSIKLINTLNNYRQCVNKTSILQTVANPFIKKADGLTYKPLTSDVCDFKGDRSLCPKFLDSLLKIEGTPFEIADKTQNKILSVMGYKKPELVNMELIIQHYNFLNDRNIFARGSLEIPNVAVRFYNSIPTGVNLVGTIIHELDHLNTFAKIVATAGIDKFEKAVSQIDRRPLNRAVWLELSKDADTKNFDAEACLQDMFVRSRRPNKPVESNWDEFVLTFEDCSGPVESSAYQKEKMVRKHFGITEPTVYEVYVEGFGKIYNLLKEYENRPDLIARGFNGKDAFEEVFLFNKMLAQPEGIGRLMQMDEASFNRVMSRPYTWETQMELFDGVYEDLKAGRFTFEDFIDV